LLRSVIVIHLVFVLSILLSACNLAQDTAAFENPATQETPGSSAAPVEASGTPVYTPSVDLDQVMSSPDYGMQVFLYWQEEVAGRDLQLVQNAGFRWVKQELPWREIEGATKGAWHWDTADRIMDQIDAHDLKVIVRLGSQPAWAADIPLPEIGPPDHLPDFYDYVFAVASRYKGRVEAYQIWNEPNLAREWGNRPPDRRASWAILRIPTSSRRKGRSPVGSRAWPGTLPRGSSW
jgi:hypothetical protein